jgi:hypothetical protein
VPGEAQRIELPPEIASHFVEDMRAYLVERSGRKREEIAARQMHILRAYQRPSEKPVNLLEVTAMFEQMREHLDARVRNVSAAAQPGGLT